VSNGTYRLDSDLPGLDLDRWWQNGKPSGAAICRWLAAHGTQYTKFSTYTRHPKTSQDCTRFVETDASPATLRVLMAAATMPSNDWPSITLCGAFARAEEIERALTAVHVRVISDTAGTGTALAMPGVGLGIVACDAGSFSLERLTALIRDAARAGARVLVFGPGTPPQDIIACFRAGAADYVVCGGADDVRDLVARLVELSARDDAPASIRLEPVYRIVAKLEHDLKNPISNILGYIDILREDTGTPPDAEQADLLGRIEGNCNRALELLAQFTELAGRTR